MAESTSSQAVDRRLFLKRAGVVAWSAPVILTLMQEKASAQACLANNATCATLVDPDGPPASNGTCNTTGFASCCTGLSCAISGNACKCG